jgi:hypothetical protein
LRAGQGYSHTLNGDSLHHLRRKNWVVLSPSYKHTHKERKAVAKVSLLDRFTCPPQGPIGSSGRTRASRTPALPTMQPTAIVHPVRRQCGPEGHGVADGAERLQRAKSRLEQAEPVIDGAAELQAALAQQRPNASNLKPP